MQIRLGKLEKKFEVGIGLLEQYGFLQISDDGLCISAKPGDEISLQKTQDMLTITYDTEAHFYMALARGLGMPNGAQTISPKLEKLGFMLDCSRNAVPKVEEIKRLVCLLALMGYNYLELYTEDTYELPEEPYFGYKRGRYSEEELREVVVFARGFGLEVIPCIQTLAHLRNLANWQPYFDHMDIDDILMVGDERTYTLIRKMLTFCKQVYETDRVHIGMDEAFRLGRGKYTDTYGYRSKHEIYLEHLKKVFDICEEVGVKPEFWADGFYDTDLPIEEIQAIFNGNQTPIYWEYSVAEKEPHEEKMKQLKTYAGKVIYAGGLWKWLGYAPDNGLSDRVADKVFEAAFECGVSDIVMTAWGDNGAECSVYAVVPSMWHATELIYPMQVDCNVVLKMLTGYTDDEWRMCDKMNIVMPDVKKMCNAMKYLLHNDFLIGLMDANIPDHAGEVYRDLLPQFEVLARKESPFAYLFETYAVACKVLITKATYSKRLYAAYQRKDVREIEHMIEELEPMKADLRVFYDAMRVQWMKENKGFGFEVLDVRIGGLISRIDTVKYVLKEYLEGRMEKIYELEEGRIEYFCGRLQGDEVYAPFHNHWGTMYTVNHI